MTRHFEKKYTSLFAWEDDARQLGYVEHEEDNYSCVKDLETGEILGEYLQLNGWLLKEQ